MQTSPAALILRLVSVPLLAMVAGCIALPASGGAYDPASPRPVEARTEPVVFAPPPPPRVVEVVETAPPPAGRVTFYSEPNFRGESFVIETGAAVENLGRLPRNRGSWNNGVSSLRIEGIATVLAYADADFRGPRLVTSSSLRDLVAERRSGGSDANWDRVISSIRVIPPHSHAFDREPGYDAPTASNIVQRAYRDILGRDADADGLRSYREKLIQRGWSEEDVRNDLHRSREFHAINPDEVIARAYREVLKREPDPEGLRHYRDLLNNHGWTTTQLRADLLRSEEHSAEKIREIITRAYRTILDRDPDPSGYATYERDVREKGWSEQQVRESLMKSAEYRQKHSR